MPVDPPRSAAQRRTDTEARLRNEIDCWVATAGGSDSPYLIVLSFLWADDVVWLSTAVRSPTIRNLDARPRIRLGFGSTRDVVILEGTTELLTPAALPPGVGDAFATKTGFDPRRLRSPYAYARVTPTLIQAWREENELAERDLMRDGVWLA